MKLLSLFLLLMAGVLFAPSSSEAMCYYNKRDAACTYNVRWRPSGIFSPDQLWTVVEGDRKCSVDNDGKINLVRFVSTDGKCFDDCVINSIINAPDPGNSNYDVTIFPKCFSNAHIEDHGWVELYTTSEYSHELGCGCGNWVDLQDNIKGACPDIGAAQDANNNDGFECRIYNDDGHEIYP